MLDELFEKKGQSIFSFKKGDIIIRLKPRIMYRDMHNENLNITTQIREGEDHSYRYPLEFYAIANNQIYLRDIKEDSFWKKKMIHKLNLDQYSENWGLLEIPEGLTIDDCL